MTPHALQLRIALALGLPCAAACSSNPPVVPVIPTDTTTSSTTATTKTPQVEPTTASTCKADEVHEHVCGLVSTDYEGSGGPAPAPYEHCTMNALSVWDLDWNHVIDGWRLGSHDPVLASFTFDAPGTDAFEYEGTYYPENPRCCYERCNPIHALPVPRASLRPGATEYELCVYAPVTTAFPSSASKHCPVALRTRHFYPEGAEDPLDDAPFVRAEDDQCCYSVATLHRCPPNTFEVENGCEAPNPGGRPLRENGAIVIAPTRVGEGWHAALRGDAGESSVAARERAAVRWAREAAYEHASVAAFARLAIDLMVHGAPSDLVDAAHVAARDEIRHAQRCYGIASELAGEILGPGPLELGATSTKSLEQLAVECFRDGCVDETVAALSVAEGSRRSSSPSIRDALAEIADDEGRHAELSYRILAWALRVGGPALGETIAAELDRVRTELARPVAAIDEARDHDEAFGLLSPRTAAAVRRRVLADVVVPCTEALLAAHTIARDVPERDAVPVDAR
jgi:hypothetical protein